MTTQGCICVLTWRPDTECFPWLFAILVLRQKPGLAHLGSLASQLTRDSISVSRALGLQVGCCPLWFYVVLGHQNSGSPAWAGNTFSSSIKEDRSFHRDNLGILSAHHTLLTWKDLKNKQKLSFLSKIDRARKQITTKLLQTTEEMVSCK